MSEHFWDSVLEAKTFNSASGHVLLAEAKKKLAPMDAKLPLDLVGEVTALMIKEAPYAFWPAMKKQRTEHVATIVAELKKARAVQAMLLCEAFAADEAPGFLRAGALLAALDRNSHLPGALKSLPKKWDELELGSLASAADRTVAAHLSDEPNTLEIIAFWSLVYLVARAAPDAKVLGSLEQACQNWVHGPEVLARVRAALPKA